MMVEEFDYSTPGVVYEENGVTITAFPAIHILDGPVSYRLDWNGMSFVYSGDTHPNKWFIEHGQNADMLVHESFVTVPQLIERQGSPRTSLGRSAPRSTRRLPTVGESSP